MWFVKTVRRNLKIINYQNVLIAEDFRPRQIEIFLVCSYEGKEQEKDDQPYLMDEELMLFINDK